MEEYNRLYKIYVEKSNSDLIEIINPANGHSEIAVEVAKDILCYERNVYDEESINNLFSGERKGISRKINFKALSEGGIRDSYFIQLCGTMLLLITIYPVGMFFLWKNKKFDKSFKVIESICCLAVWICVMFFSVGKMNQSDDLTNVQSVVERPDNFVMATEEQMAQLPDREGMMNVINEWLKKVHSTGETKMIPGNFEDKFEVITLEAYGTTPELKNILVSLQYVFSEPEPEWTLVSVENFSTYQYYYVMDELKNGFDLYDYNSGYLVSEKTESLEDIQNRIAKDNEAKKKSSSGGGNKANQASDTKSSTNFSEKKDSQNQNIISKSSDNMPETEKTDTLKVSRLFNDVYLPYAKREKAFSFEGVKTFAQNTKEYTVDMKEPGSEDGCFVKFTDENGDYVYFAFSPNEDGTFTIILVSFYQASSNSEVSLSNYSLSSSPEYDTYETHIIGNDPIEVSGVDKQQEFLFQ